MSDGPIGYEVRRHCALITLQSPETGNAIGPEGRKGLIDAWARAGADPQVRAVIVTGKGERHFCTGAQLGQRESGDVVPTVVEDQPIWEPYVPRGSGIRKPVIGAINGVCAGSGLLFVAQADFAICSENASFLQPHVTIGIIPHNEPLVLARRIPLGAVLRMALLGRHDRMSAQQALQLGLVSEVVPLASLVDRALELGEIIALNSPEAVRQTRELIWRSLELPLTEALREAWTVGDAHLTHPDVREGALAFIEKRDPHWAD